MIDVLLVFIGGGLGSVLRYLAGVLFKFFNISHPAFSTFFINITGSFVLGFLSIYLLTKAHIPQHYKLMLTVGFCGGLTTFSAFSLETVNLFNEGYYLHALGYVLSSTIICCLAVFLGAYCAKCV